MILRPLCTWQRWISAKLPKVSRTARLSALAPSTMNRRAISGCSPRSIRSASSALTTAAFSVAPKATASTCLSPAPSMPIAATRIWSPTRGPSIWSTSRSSRDRSVASHSFSFAVLSATNRRETEDFVVARLARPARSPSGSRTERAYLRVATPISIWLNAQRDSKSAFWIAVQLGSSNSASPRSRTLGRRMAALPPPTDLTADHAPSMALPVSVALVALAAKLFRIRRKHRLDCRSPSLQAQSVKAALELLKPLDHHRWQRQRARRQRRTLVEPLQFDMLRHGVDLLALGLRFATSSLVA